LHTAELGVVMFLFIIGLEMRPSKLWTLRRQIFWPRRGTGRHLRLSAHAGRNGGEPQLPVAMIGAMGFVLSSTAVIMQLLEEQDETTSPEGQRASRFCCWRIWRSCRCWALVALWGAVDSPAAAAAKPMWQSAGIAVAGLAALLAAGRWLLDPFFRVIARAGAREVLTAPLAGRARLSGVHADASPVDGDGAPFWRACCCRIQFPHQSSERTSSRFAASCSGLFFLSVACR